MTDNIVNTITVVATIISVIVSLIIATKNTNSKIRDTQDKIRDTQDKIRDTQDLINDIKKNIENLCNSLIHDIGIAAPYKGSLTDQHAEISDLIIEESVDQKKLIESNTNTVIEINERSKKEQQIREEREKHLTPEMLEIKDVVTAIKNMEQQMEKLNAELAKKSEAFEQLLRKYYDFVNKYERLNNENQLLETKLKKLSEKNMPDFTAQRFDGR